MKEKTLIITAIICIIIGLPSLFFASQFVKADDPRILSSLSGKVVKIAEKDKITIIDVEMDNAMPIVSFDKIKIKKGDRVEIKGEIATYKGKLEFVADKVERK
ncbi:hypothetical protein JW851_03540 [Candidatus Woesearchaeota archaeon]|nr:hypothetical protein [Candidatus Woesearchaeota archaeon]